MPSRDLEPGLRPQTPLSADFAAQQAQKQQGNNYHSSSLGKMINSNTVNKTSLHPGGVAYVYIIILDRYLSLILSPLQTPAGAHRYRGRASRSSSYRL